MHYNLISRFLSYFQNKSKLTSIFPKGSLRNNLASITVNIGLAEMINFWTDNGICWRAKYAAIT